jgi:hypothetical protein
VLVALLLALMVALLGGLPSPDGYWDVCFCEPEGWALALSPGGQWFAFGRVERVRKVECGIVPLER